jgi:hypothetical protein
MEVGDGSLKTTALRGVKNNPPYLHDQRLLHTGVVGLNDRCLCSDGRRQTLLMPPSTTMSEPVMNELSSEARKKRVPSRRCH